MKWPSDNREKKEKEKSNFKYLFDSWDPDESWRNEIVLVCSADTYIECIWRFPDVGKRRQRNILCKSTNYLTKITEKRKQIRQRFNINFLFHVLHILDHKRPSHVRKLFNEFNTRKNISLSETWHFNILLFHIRHELKQLITWSTKSRLNGPPLLLQSIKCDNSRTHRESFIIALSLTRVKYLIKRNIRQVFAIRCMTRNSFDIA